MPKFSKAVGELETHFEKWMYVIKNLKRLDRLPDKLREKVFEKMFEVAEVAEVAKLSKEEYKDYIDSLNSYRDVQNSIDYAKKEGEAIGLERGEAQKTE